MARSRWAIAAAIAAGAVAASAAWAFEGGEVTIGQTVNSGYACLPQQLLIQTHVTSGNSFAVPAGSWQLTSWSVSTGTDTGGVAAALVTKIGPHAFTVDAISPTETPAPNALSTYPWSVAVHSGELLAVWVAGDPDDIDCIHATGKSGDTFEDRTGSYGKPTSGQNEPTTPDSGGIINVAATLAPVGPAAAAVDHVYTCYSKWEQDGGEVDDPGVGAALVAAGRWYPTALPGNVDGAENVGDYHLACNPPSTVQPTGQYVGIGGAMTSTWSQGYYAIAQ